MSVITFVKNWNGKFKKASYELISYSKALADKMSCDLIVVSIGDVDKSELEKLGDYGASRIISVENKELKFLRSRAYAETLIQIINKENAEVVVFTNSLSGQSLAPRLSVKLNCGIVTGVLGLPLSTDPFIVEKSLFSGKAKGKIKISSKIKLLTIAKNSFGTTNTPTTPNIETFTPIIDSKLLTLRLNSIEEYDTKVLLSDADTVLSGGRGMREGESWKHLDELAESIGAATACSRPVADEGWRDAHDHVGQTGKIISPNLYMAFGISGAIQHIAGVSRSKCIVAINKDPEAPIFDYATYGVVGDLNELIPKIKSEIEKL